MMSDIFKNLININPMFDWPILDLKLWLDYEIVGNSLLFYDPEIGQECFRRISEALEHDVVGQQSTSENLTVAKYSVRRVLDSLGILDVVPMVRFKVVAQDELSEYKVYDYTNLNISFRKRN